MGQHRRGSVVSAEETQVPQRKLIRDCRGSVRSGDQVAGRPGRQPEAWLKYKNYADHVWVELRFLPWAGAEESVEDWVLSLNPGAEFDQDWLLRHIESLGYQEPTPGDYHIGQPVYNMEIIGRKFSWGAEVSTFSILMDVGIGVLGNAAWEGIKAIRTQLANKMKRDRLAVQPLGEQEAVERTRWILGRKYELREEQLFHVAVEMSHSDAIVTMTDEVGVAYRVQLVESDGLVLLARISRTFPHEANDS
jgi:hypothetical protein